MALTTHIHLAPRLRTRKAIPILCLCVLWCVMGLPLHLGQFLKMGEFSWSSVGINDEEKQSKWEWVERW